MSISYAVRSGGRPQLGSPIIPINSPARYLRHRVAAERSYRARRQAARLQRLVALVIICLLYLAIGREIIHLTRAKMSLASTEMRSDAQTLAQSLKKMLRPSPQGDQAPAAPEQAGALPDAASSLLDQP